MAQRKLASLTTDTIPKQQFGGRNGFSMVNALAKMISCAEKNQRWNQVTSVLAIVIKCAFDNVHKGVLLNIMSEMDFPEVSRCWVIYFLSRRRTSLIIDGKGTEPRYVDSGIPQGPPISLLLFLIYTSSQYKRLGKLVLMLLGSLMTLLSIKVVGTSIRTLQH
jgi:hypothetical protein